MVHATVVLTLTVRCPSFFPYHLRRFVTSHSRVSPFHCVVLCAFVRLFTGKETEVVCVCQCACGSVCMVVFVCVCVCGWFKGVLEEDGAVNSTQMGL